MSIDHADLEELFNRIADGIASEADEARLAELLRGCEEARRSYREFMSLHSALHWDYVATAVAEESVPTVNADRTPSRRFASRPASKPRMRPVGMAFIAGVILAGTVAMTLESFHSHSTEDPTPAPDVTRSDLAEGQDATPPSSIAAILVDEVKAKFAAGKSPDGVGLSPGDYELRKGIVHLRFVQGADVVLEGPAHLTVNNPQLIRLHHGKVRVTAPPSAKGFTIVTPNAEYIDLGTEFGLRVDSHDGVSDLYVFDGQVNVAEHGSGKVLSEVLLGESSRVANGELGVAPRLDENEFPEPGKIGNLRWRQYATNLRKDPRLLAFYLFDKVSNDAVLANAAKHSSGDARDQDQSNSVFDSRLHGTIVGARWTTGRWPGKQALLFDRDTDFVSIDIPGEHDELTIAAWIKLDRLDFVFNAILNSDGYDLGDIHFQLTRQGYPRGGVAVSGPIKDTLGEAHVAVGRWTHVASVLSTKTRSVQIYVNGSLARERRWISDQVLRPGSCRLGNWLSTTGVGPMDRAFRGRIDELAIWGHALTKEEVMNLVDAGRPKTTWIN